MLVFESNLFYIQKGQLSGYHPPHPTPVGVPKPLITASTSFTTSDRSVALMAFFRGSDKATEDTTILIHTPAYSKKNYTP